MEVFGAFGLTTNTDYYTVDTGGGLVFKVRRTDNGVSTQSAGDLMSLVYNGVEYQDQSRGSQLNSGFDYLYAYTNKVVVSADVYGTNYIKITVVCGDPSSGQGGVTTHYYMARNGYPHIYMATSFNVEPDTLGLCRYILRIPSNLLSNGPGPSDIRNTDYTVESSDIFGYSMTNANVALRGQTRSKHYSNMRLIDWSYIGATGTNVGVFILRSNHEGDSGGPYYRSLLNQCGSDQEITYIVNYGEAQTEAFRTNILNGPYTIVFTGGGLPSTNLDYSWIESTGMNLTNWVSRSGRGVVKGTATGVPTGFQPVVVLNNTNAQYWTVADANGNYVSPPMIPGVYTAKLYKQELAVVTNTVTVTAGTTNTLNLTSAEATPTYIWKIGEWDGTPAGMLNADKFNTMHPSDVRMSSWSPWPFVVESNNVSQFPCVQFRATNTPAVIKFNLTAGQITTLTCRIGTTCAYIGGRPQISVNSWTSSFSSAPSQPSTRSTTIGTYRENNYLYTFSIPSSALVVGQNTLQISPVSGSADSGPWLSAGWVYDCVELDGPVVSAPTMPTGLKADAGNAQVILHWNGSPAATGYKVKRATTSGGPFTTIATGVKPPVFTDASVANGTTYFYVVSATNSVGESSDSTSVSTTPSDVINWWKFDDASGAVATDSIGGDNGTLLSAASWTTGRNNGAVHLNGTANSYVSLPAGIVTNLNDFTIATWVKVDTNATWARIFDFGTGTGNYMFLAPASGSSSVRYAITTTSTAGEQQISNNAVLSTGVWHHVAVTLSGTNGILFVDGSPAGTNSNMTLRPSDLGPTTQNYFGKSQWSDPNLIGNLDDFRIYNRALSAAEINSLANLPPVPTGLLATTGDSSVRLSWNVSSGAASYYVKRATTSGGPYTPVANVAVLNYTNTGLANGVQYYFVVSATNSFGEGANSLQASARPVATNSPTMNFITTGGQLQIAWPNDHLGWSLQAQTNLNGSGLGTNWVTVPGSSNVLQLTLPVDTASLGVFYRLVYP
jgi:rhamnogalacturonan endolyase